MLATAVQLQSSGVKPDNLQRAARLVGLAAEAGAKLVALPEVFAWRGRQDQERTVAEPIPGPVAEFAAELADRFSIHLVAGSILELDEASTSEPARCFNTTVLYGPGGEQLAKYRKIHLFDIDIPGEVTIKESDTRRAGDDVVCVETEIGIVGLAICYDLRFPELFRRLADAGAEIVVMPSAFTKTTGQAHWKPLIRARAIENQVYFIAPNQFGENQAGFSEYGHSLIVDPWGEVLAEGPEDDEALVSAELSLDRLAEVRKRLPSLDHRRLS